MYGIFVFIGSLYIQWDPPDMKVLQYEIERELVYDEKHLLKEEDAQVTLYDGSLVSVRIIGLAPGCTYRLLSCNVINERVCTRLKT